MVPDELIPAVGPDKVEEAIRMVNDVLNEKNLSKRIKATTKVLAKANRIPANSKLPWSKLVEQCLKDGLESGALANSQKVLSFDFSANDKKKFLTLAVAPFVRVDDVKSALDWVETVSYVFGQKAILGLKKDKAFSALHKTKKFQTLIGPKARVSMLRDDLNESIREWKNKDYDNIKDVIFISKTLVKEIPKSEKVLLAKAKKHRDAVLKAAREMMEEDPDLADYLKGLI